MSNTEDYKGKILITQELSSKSRELFDKLGKRYNVKVVYHSFFKYKGIDVSSFRKLGLNVLGYSAIIFTNKVAVDNFYSLLKKLGIELPLTIRYFCISEQLAMYLQKYIILRKRRLHYPKKVKGKDDIFKILDKYKDSEKFLFVGRVNTNHKILQYLKKNKFNFSFLPVYDLEPNPYDNWGELKGFLLITFSAVPSIEMFVKFAEKDKDLLKIPVGVYGKEVKRVAKKHKLNIVFEGPTKERKTFYSLVCNYLDNVVGNKN